MRLDDNAVRAAVDPALYQAAEELLSSDRLGEIVEVGGGVASTVDSGADRHHQVWAGVVLGEFTGVCDCPQATAEPDELCVHAVAITLGARDAGSAWSSAATPPSRLGPADAAELATLRHTFDRLLADAVAGRWGPSDIAAAGGRIVEELETLSARPASEAALALVEHAATVWDTLAVDLYDTWAAGCDPEAIGGAIRDVHVRVCAELEIDSVELVERLSVVVGRSAAGSCLDEPEEYADLLGVEGVAALRADNQ